MKEFRVVQHLLDFFLGAAVIQECLHFISGNAECLRHAEQIVITGRRVLVIAAVERIFSPPVLERRVRCEDACSDTAGAVDFYDLALLWLQNIGGRFQPQLFDGLTEDFLRRSVEQKTIVEHDAQRVISDDEPDGVVLIKYRKDE